MGLGSKPYRGREVHDAIFKIRMNGAFIPVFVRNNLTIEGRESMPAKVEFASFAAVLDHVGKLIHDFLHRFPSICGLLHERGL